MSICDYEERNTEFIIIITVVVIVLVIIMVRLIDEEYEMRLAMNIFSSCLHFQSDIYLVFSSFHLGNKVLTSRVMLTVFYLVVIILS